MTGHEAQISAGIATVNITPNEPVLMGGYGGREGRSSGANDPLLATALVLDDDANRVGLVAVDLLNVSRELTGRVRRQLADQGHRFDEFLLVASHTHAGPYMSARAFDISPSFPVDDDISDVEASIEAGIVDAVGTAARSLSPSSLRVGTATVSGVAENRRAAGGVSGNVRVPFGPVDEEVVAVYLEPAEGDPAILYNFACHPVCTTGQELLLSADWPGYARTHITAAHSDAAVLFLNGATGDINPAGGPGGDEDETPYDFMDRVGAAVAEGVLAAIDNATADTGASLTGAPLRTDGIGLTLPTKRTPPATDLRALIEELKREREACQEAGDDVGARSLTYRLQHARELCAIAEWDATSLPNRMPYIEIGELGILGMPGEVHVRHGLRFKRAATVDHLMPVGYVNDYVGYLPTLTDLEHVGYEVRTAKVAPEGIVEFNRAARALVTDSHTV